MREAPVFAVAALCCGFACTVMMLAVAYRIKTLAPLVALALGRRRDRFARLCVGCSGRGSPRRRENPSQHPCLCFETSPWTASRRLEKRRPRVPGYREGSGTDGTHTHAREGVWPSRWCDCILSTAASVVENYSIDRSSIGANPLIQHWTTLS